MAFFSYASVAPDEYRVYLADFDNRTKHFRIDIPSSKNPRGFRMFQSYIRQGVKLDSHGNPKVGVVLGDLVRTTPTKLHHFNFKFDPRSVRWNDFATEACDGRLIDVEENLDQWLQLGRFCPWTTRSMIVRIVKNNKVIWKRAVPTNLPNRYSSLNTDLPEN